MPTILHPPSGKIVEESTARAKCPPQSSGGMTNPYFLCIIWVRTRKNWELRFGV